MFKEHQKSKSYSAILLLCGLFCVIIVVSCNSRSGGGGEQVRVAPGSSLEDTLSNSIQNDTSSSQIGTYPRSVIATGLPEHRLITLFKNLSGEKQSNRRGLFSYSDKENSEGYTSIEPFIPGIDMIGGYNLLNVAHYDLKTEKLKFLFTHSVLIKTLYYPSYEQDSINKKPINRDYYLTAVYDEDTNKDSLINDNDLRKLYHFNTDCSVKTQIIPNNYNMYRAEYDTPNDVLYIFAEQDSNNNGKRDEAEPTHVFWVDLKSPAPAKRMY